MSSKLYTPPPAAKVGEAAVYLRVSSDSQTTKNQEPDLQAWSSRQEGHVHWFRDVFTGTSMERPGFGRLAELVRVGRIRTVAVWRLDRLGRTASGLLQLCDEWAELGVNLVSLKEGVDLSTSAGRLLLGILASVAAFETEVRHERQIAGIARAKAEGKKWGGRKPGQRVKVTRELERMVAQLADQDESISAIARTVGLSRPTIYGILSDREKAA